MFDVILMCLQSIVKYQCTLNRNDFTMSQGEPRQLASGKMRSRLGQLEHQVSSQEGEIKRLKQIIEEICEIHNVAPPDLRYGHYVPILDAEITDRDCEQEDEEHESKNKELTNKLIAEMIVNAQRTGRRHSVESKKAFATICLQSVKAYKALEQILPVPSHKTLLRFAKGPITNIRERIENIQRTKESLKLFREHYGLVGPVYGVLAIDACSHESYLPAQSKQPSSLESSVQLEEFLAAFGPVEDVHVRPVLKYSFVFYFQPLCASLPCFPVHVSPESNGSAQEKHINLLDDLTDILRKEKFIVVMKCSDGDNKYYQSTTDSYNSIMKICRGNFDDVERIARLSLHIRDGLVPFGADMLHLIKNARTRLLYRRISLDVRDPVALNLAVIKRLLPVPRECFEKTDLSKMMDALPILLFTFENAKTLLSQGYRQEGLFFLIFALFHGFFRANCDHVTRLGIGVTLIRTLQKYHDYLEETTRKKECRCLEYHRSAALLTMFPVKQLERMTVTVATAVSLMAHLDSGVVIGLDRLSTHPLENFFGHLRVFCSFKHTYENIVEKMARTQFIQRVKTELGLSSSINKRLNTGGQRIKIDNISVGFRDVDFATSIMALIDWSYFKTYCSGEGTQDEHRGVVNYLVDFLATLKIPGLNVTGKYSGVQILNRLIINSRSESQEAQANSQ